MKYTWILIAFCLSFIPLHAADTREEASLQCRLESLIPCIYTLSINPIFLPDERAVDRESLDNVGCYDRVRLYELAHREIFFAQNLSKEAPLTSLRYLIRALRRMMFFMHCFGRKSGIEQASLACSPQYIVRESDPLVAQEWKQFVLELLPFLRRDIQGKDLFYSLFYTMRDWPEIEGVLRGGPGLRYALLEVLELVKLHQSRRVARLADRFSPGDHPKFEGIVC